MPCYDERTSVDYQEKEANRRVAREREKRDAAAQSACSALRALEAAGLPIPEEAREWWEKHKEWDAKRRSK